MRNQKLEITGTNTGHYNGARAYFDSTCIKTATLTPKEQTKILKSAKDGEVPEG